MSGKQTQMLKQTKKFIVILFQSSSLYSQSKLFPLHHRRKERLPVTAEESISKNFRPVADPCKPLETFKCRPSSRKEKAQGCEYQHMIVKTFLTRLLPIPVPKAFTLQGIQSKGSPGGENRRSSDQQEKNRRNPIVHRKRENIPIDASTKAFGQPRQGMDRRRRTLNRTTVG